MGVTVPESSRCRRESSAVLPDPAGQGAAAGQGDPVEAGQLVSVEEPAECPGVLLRLPAVLGPRDGHGALGPHPVEGDLAGPLAAVLAADAPEFVDDAVDHLH